MRKFIKAFQRALIIASSERQSELGFRPSRKYLELSLIALTSACVFAFIFLCFAKTDEVVMATGRLAPEGNVKIIQMPQGGVIKDLLVKEGDLVQQGQVLVELNGEVSKEVVKATKQSIAAKVKESLHKEDELSRYLEGNKSEQDYLLRSIKINRQVLNKYKILQRSGAVSEIQLLEQQMNLERDISLLNKLKFDAQRETALSNQVLQRLSSEKDQFASKLAEIQYLDKNTKIRSPEAGIVFDIKPKGSSFVAQGTEPLMKIVPKGDLNAIVYVSSDKIGFVKKNQAADVSIDSYPASDFGTLKGRVEQVGSDSLPPDQNFPYYRYPVNVKLSSQRLATRKGSYLPLRAGMSVVVNMKLRKVSYLQLLLSDFQDKTDSLRQI